MSIWNTLFGWMGVSNASGLDDGSPTMQQDIGCQNPATGLPMAGNCIGMDIAGNPYGTDLSSIHSHTSSAIDSGSGWSGMPDSSDPFFSPWGD